jgi:hypothetical protein
VPRLRLLFLVAIATFTFASAASLAETDNRRDDDTRSPAERRGEALADVCGFYLDYHKRVSVDPDADAPKVPKKRNLPHLIAVTQTGEMRHRSGAQLLDGPHIDHQAFEALSCTAQLLRLVLDEDGAIRSYQMLPATVTDALFQAIAARDQGCRWPGCHKKPIHCDVHHLHHQENGGINSPCLLVRLRRNGLAAPPRNEVASLHGTRRNPAHHLRRRNDRNHQTPNPTTRPTVELTKSSRNGAPSTAWSAWRTGSEGRINCVKHDYEATHTQARQRTRRDSNRLFQVEVANRGAGRGGAEGAGRGRVERGDGASPGE